ncbi:GNAT family N-acetyltransferase [Cellulomonas soli]|uniref:GNAT family N-acetyltransferase n=1 Tax=Cellulomonas soli TaxID=931535 RepID=UPI003F87E95E
MSDHQQPLSVRADAPAVLVVPTGPDRLNWRPMSPADAPALGRLVARIEDHEGAPFRTSVEEVAEMFDGDWKDHARDTLAAVDDDGELRAYAQVSTVPGDTGVVRVFTAGGVDPTWRGRGIGRALAAWMTGRGRQLLAASELDAPGRIAAYVDDHTPDTLALYLAAGYTPVRYYNDMRRSLTEPLPQAPAVPGISIVAWTPALDEAVRVAHNEAFADHWGSEPRTPEVWQRGRSMFAPQWSFVAVEDATGDVVGYLLSDRFEQDWAVAGYTSGYTHLLGVRRAWRGRGLAVALLSAAMAAYRADGMQYAEIGVDTANPSGAHGLYAALGYEVRHTSTMLSIEI